METSQEMFNFNVSAMGFGLSEPWMRMVLLQLDDLVMHVTNTTRIKEECEKLALFLSKHQGPILLSEVRASKPKRKTTATLQKCSADEIMNIMNIT